MATLEILSGPAAGVRYEVPGGQTVLGRDPFCDVVLPIRSISRQHARIVNDGDQYYVEDLHSLNGTFVNGQRVAGRTKLKHRDQIQLYEILLAFYEAWPDPRQAPAARAVAAAPAPPEAPRLRTTIVGALDANVVPNFEVGARAKLQAVLSIMRGLGETLAPDVFLPNVLESLFEIFPQAENGYILLADPETAQLVPQAIKSRRGEQGSSTTMGAISRTVAERVMAAGEAILSSVADSGEASILDQAGGSTMTVPLIGPSRRPLGIVHVESGDSGQRFTSDDLEVLLSVGAVAGQAVEFSQIHQSQLRLDRRERDLATAREVQLHFLPHDRPMPPGYRLFDYYQAAEDVGGDYFGYLPLADGRLAIALGDVSGKGVSAALLMARLCSEVRYCLAVAANPAEAIERLNRELTSATLNDRFVTFLLCVLDPRTHQLEIINAGHLPPLRRRGPNVTKLGLNEAGPPLGFDPTQTYQPFTTTLDAIDTIILCTDGITEARSPGDTIYGTQRLCRILANGPTEVDSLSRYILDDVARFASDRAQSDDVCLVVLGRE